MTQCLEVGFALRVGEGRDQVEIVRLVIECSLREDSEHVAAEDGGSASLYAIL